MVKGKLRPVCRDMTVGTPGAVPSFMHIVVTMTGYAFGRRRGIVLAYMAGVTARGYMSTGERKSRAVVVEANETPVGRVVAITAGLAEGAVVHVIILVTSHAFCIRSAKSVAPDMTGVAVKVGMRSE